ncbi:MAG TPA: hypothetical protein VLW50_28055 [Streptosporangiaceae bacterium]|nr:hypothetical protein [Streptosporangiaceae bacterium]
MAAELGQTSDPAALIPGNPAALYETVAALLAYADVLAEAGAGLQRIGTTGGWSGPAADSFRCTYHPQPAKWLQAAAAFQDAAHSIESYAATLAWAQDMAVAAMSQWNTGAAAHPAARATLADARSQLDRAGDAAADAASRARDLAPAAPGLLSRAGSLLSGLGHDAEIAGAHVINGLASFGNAAIHDPGALATAVGGAGLTAVSAGGEGLGLALDATGVGAVPGVALGGLSAAGMAVGVSAAGAGLAVIARDAATSDHVSLMNASGTSAGSGGSDPAGTKVSDILKSRKGSIKQAPLPPGSPSWNEIQDMTLSDVQAGANAKLPGYKTILKLLRDRRFAK